MEDVFSIKKVTSKHLFAICIGLFGNHFIPTATEMHCICMRLEASFIAFLGLEETIEGSTVEYYSSFFLAIVQLQTSENSGTECIVPVVLGPPKMIQK